MKKNITENELIYEKYDLNSEYILNDYNTELKYNDKKFVEITNVKNKINLKYFLIERGTKTGQLHAHIIMNKIFKYGYLKENWIY